MTSKANKIEEQEMTLKVLIADDDAEMRRGTRLMISMVPNAEVVAVARDGREALEMAEAHGPDVALMDINMPGMDGLEAIRALHRLRPRPVCIVISAEKDAPTVKKAVHVGAAAYLIKPFSVEEVRAVIEKTRALAAERRAQETERAAAERQQLAAKAEAYVQARRSDDEAVAVLEALAADPDAALRWSMVLAVVYVVRREWRKLQHLAEMLAHRDR